MSKEVKSFLDIYIKKMSNVKNINEFNEANVFGMMLKIYSNDKKIADLIENTALKKCKELGFNSNLVDMKKNKDKNFSYSYLSPKRFS